MAPGREDLGSWLEGTPGRGPADGGSGEPVAGDVRRASLGRRIAAVVVDWTLCMALSAVFFPSPRPAVLPILAGDPTATLGIFAVSTTVLVGLLGHTVGHRLLGLRVVRTGPSDAAAVRPGPPGLAAAAVRTLLLCLVIPAVVWDSRGRGMHDVAARTAVVRR